MSPPALARQVAANLYPLLTNVGIYILGRLLRAAINILKQQNTINVTDLQLDKSIFGDLSVLKTDGEDRWNHVFTSKIGHIKPSTDEERGVVALALKIVQKLGKNVPVRSEAAGDFKRRFELYFKESNVRMWVRECRRGQSDEYYIESGGIYTDSQVDPNELDTGGELLKLL